MARKGLGKGLESLIPDIYNEDFDSNSTQSLADILDDEDKSVEDIVEDVESSQKDKESVVKDDEKSEEDEQTDDNQAEDEIEEESNVTEDTPVEEKEEETQEDSETSKDTSSEISDKEDLQSSQEIQVNPEHVEEVKAIVEKNPRITLWSSRSSAVFRYLRKTEPEFSISKEASLLIEEAVAKKYPEIWALFDDE